ncbi:MAG: YhcH/YjgK/YiaL family protein [Oscillospiraceae bacterium]|nr:YhcH/YjgK/YiaL family protein [Oscillospiraceae bacterium]
MVFDKIQNAERYYGLGPDFELALRYLKELDRSAVVPGQTYEIGNGMSFRMTRVDCKAPDDEFYEAHRQFADIQLVVSGCEYMGVADISKLTMREDFKPDNDISWYRGHGDMLKFTADDFAIFFPEDAHMPCRTDGEHDCFSMKIVVKVRV